VICMSNIKNKKDYQKPELKIHGDLKKITAKAPKGGDATYGKPS
jgi:hypothetical protein